MQTMQQQFADPTLLLPLGVAAVSIAYIGYFLVRKVSRWRSAVVYPPGPPQDPIIGNLRNFPKENWYQCFSQWQGKYGDIIYARLPGTPLLIVNSLDVAQELLSKRAKDYSERKVGYMAREILGWYWSLAFRSPDSVHQEMRKMLKRGTGPQRVAGHHSMIETNASQLLLSFKVLKGNPFDTITKSVGNIIIQLAYGEQIGHAHGPELLKLNIDAMDILTNSLRTFWLVDVVPLMRFIPSWIPGAEFRRRGNLSLPMVRRIRSWPYELAVDLHKKGTLGRSLASDLLDEFHYSEEVQDSLAILYLSGVGTTSAVITLFLQAMFLFPDIARKVQQEISAVVGTSRLPSITDRSALVYTEAVWKEALRWTPAVPLGVPHVSKQDGNINGYFIPKGTVIHPNIGFMLNDPRIWGDPEVFRPERYLLAQNPKAASLPNPSSIIFGFGQRICPGMYLADGVAFHFSIATLAIFDVLPLEDQTTPGPTDIKYATGGVRLPTNFNCRFLQRSEKAGNLLSDIVVAEI